VRHAFKKWKEQQGMLRSVISLFAQLDFAQIFEIASDPNHKSHRTCDITLLTLPSIQNVSHFLTRVFKERVSPSLLFFPLSSPPILRISHNSQQPYISSSQSTHPTYIYFIYKICTCENVASPHWKYRSSLASRRQVEGVS
jgi:hypothetical protein